MRMGLGVYLGVNVLVASATVLTLCSVRVLQVLATLSVPERIEKTLLLLKKELELSKLQSQISKQVLAISYTHRCARSPMIGLSPCPSAAPLLAAIRRHCLLPVQVEDKISANQRRYMLLEQLKQIKKELGLERDDKEALIAKFSDRITHLAVPAEAKKVIEEEMDKIQTLESSSSEFNVTRNYLDWLTSLPWGAISASHRCPSRKSVRHTVSPASAALSVLGSPATGARTPNRYLFGGEPSTAACGTGPCC